MEPDENANAGRGVCRAGVRAFAVAGWRPGSSQQILPNAGPLLVSAERMGSRVATMRTRRHSGRHMLRPLALRRIDSRALFLSALFLLAGCNHRAPGGERLYVSDDRDDLVAGIDMPTVGVADRIEMAGRPRGMALSPDHATLYVALSAAPAEENDEGTLERPAKHRIDGVAAIDIATAKVVRVLPAGTDPVRVAPSPDGRMLFVTDQADDSITAVAADGKSRPRTVAVCESPEGITPTQDGRMLFVACVDSDKVAMLDAAQLRMKRRIRVRGGPRSVLAARDGQHVYVATDNGRLAILTPDGRIEKMLDLARDADDVRAAGMVEAPDGHLFVTTGRYGAVIEVDPKAGTIVRTIDHVGAEPMGIGLSADGTTLVTANGESGDVSLINRQSGKIVRKLNVGTRPWGIAARG